MIVARWTDANDYSSNRRAKQGRSKEWPRLSAWCVCMQMDAHDAFASNLPPFLPPLSPTTPITPYNPPNSPLKQINCLRPPRQNGATTATTGNSNLAFCKGSFSLQPSISKTTPLASRADLRRKLTWGSDWWMVCDYFTWRIDFILQSVEYVEMLHLLFLAECYGLIKIP